MILSLDGQALVILAGADSPAQRRVRRALEAARRTGRDVVVPTVVLAELYRGVGRTTLIDALLARHEGAIHCHDTDRPLARFVGAVLHATGMGSEHLADAHVVAVAAAAGGGMVLTGDVDDLARLAAPYRTVLVEPLTD